MRVKILAVLLAGLVAFFGCSKNNSTPPEVNSALSAETTGDVIQKPEADNVEGFPSGHSSPEGAACDLARAFIDCNSELFLETCIPKFGGGENATKYEMFLDKTSVSIEAESKKQNATAKSGPAKITRLYAARHLTKNGPASYGYATHNFHDVMFVDVVVELHSGESFPNRTLVLKTADGKWYVHPSPITHSLLSDGLNDESESTVEYTNQTDAANENGG